MQGFPSIFPGYMVDPLISVSTEQFYLAVSDRMSSLISVSTKFPEVDVFYSRWYDSNDLNHVCTRMVSDTIQSHKWVLFPFLFFKHNLYSILCYKSVKGIPLYCIGALMWDPYPWK